MNEKNQSYIQSVVLEGYKSIQHTKIDFEQGLNIIIGKNGSGKTNFLEFLETALSFSFRESSFSYNLKLYKSNNYLNWLVSVNQSNSFNFLIKEYLIIDKEEVVNKEREASVDNELQKYAFYIDTEVSHRKLRPIKRVIKYDVQKISFLKTPNVITIDFSLKGLSSSSYPDDIIFSIKNTILNFFEHILNLKNNLKEISEYHQEPYEILEYLKISENLKSNLKKFSNIKDVKFSNFIIPQITEHKETIAGKNPKESFYIKIDNMQLTFLVNDKWLFWNDLSDGSKRLFYIIAEICDLSEGIILLEEPELGIHPHQLHLLMQFLKEQSETKQIILTTHSPQVLDILHVNELNKIIIAEMTEEGTKLRHLTEKQKKKAVRYMEELFLSDYWVQNAGLEDEE